MGGDGNLKMTLCQVAAVWESCPLKPSPLLSSYPCGTTVKYYFARRVLVYTSTTTLPSRFSDSIRFLLLFLYRSYCCVNRTPICCGP